MSIRAARLISLEGKNWQAFWQEIRHALKFFPADPDFSKLPLANIVSLLRRLKCTHTIVGHPFSDKDYLNDYAHHLVRTFRKYELSCVRLHFFNSKYANDDTAVLLERVLEQQKLHPDRIAPGPYLGFMVIRPTGRDCVGRTVIQTPDPAVYPERIHAAAKYESHLADARLTVYGTPFMQQDGTSHRCAGVALWSMCCDLHRRYQSPRLFMNEIIRIATEIEPRSTLSSGLTAVQVARVLRHIGCANDTIAVNMADLNNEDRKKRLREVTDFIYGYVQSNIPVLVGYTSRDQKTAHMVLVVGHDLEPEPVMPNAEGRWSSEYVSRFYCLDDQRGPYQPLQVWADDKQWNGPIETPAGVPALQSARNITVCPGLSANVTMGYSMARRRIEEWHSRIVPYINSIPSTQQTDQWRVLLKDAVTKCRLRLYCQLSTRFRKQLRESRGRTGIGGDIRRAYCWFSIPEYICICDFCSKTPDESSRFDLHGEILIDATAQRCDRRSIVAVRFKDQLEIQNNGKKELMHDKDWDDNVKHYAPVNSEAYDRH